MVIKKRISALVVLTCLLLVALTGCGSTTATEKAQPSEGAQSEASGKNQTQPQGEQRKILVAYFSSTGHTQSLAKNTAEVLQADLYEIVPQVPYTKNDLNYNDESTRATVEQKNANARPAISGKAANFEKYDTIVLAYPIWWGQAPRIIDTFVESYDFSNKTIVPICTSASSEIGSSADALRPLCSSSAKWVAGKRFSEGTSKNELSSWFASIKIIDKK
ncbi:flavodoxin [Bacteroides sp.]|uniref:flavodoxin n=1 Tax=Bacteroides sp. TaxID=29523 RepID=UPI0026019B86|nr:flavodoxin [Bacteroides sp.]MDD3040833.1 flavodoxin [Bacteroides sp.]